MIRDLDAAAAEGADSPAVHGGVTGTEARPGPRRAVFGTARLRR